MVHEITKSKRGSILAVLGIAGVLGFLLIYGTTNEILINAGVFIGIGLAILYALGENTPDNF